MVGGEKIGKGNGRSMISRNCLLDPMNNVKNTKFYIVTLRNSVKLTKLLFYNEMG